MVTKKSRREQAEVSQVTARERRHARREMKEILTTMRLDEERFKERFKMAVTASVEK